MFCHYNWKSSRDWAKLLTKILRTKIFDHITNPIKEITMKKLQILILVAAALSLQVPAYASSGNASNSHVPTVHVPHPVASSSTSSAK
jgi:hypothetical protein